MTTEQSLTNWYKKMREKGMIQAVYLSVAGTAFALTQSASAIAQQEQQLRLEEIIVTAKRRPESIQNVPVSITAFSEATIRRNMFTGVEDYLVRAPSVSVVTTGARDRKDLSIRGVSNLLTIDSSKRVNTFAFYIDDFNVVHGTTNPQIMDLERIEVLRGPQGTYFGRNAIGGAISLVTKKPDMSGTYLEGTLDYSRYNTWDVEGILNLPLVSDKLAIRLNGKHRESDGHIRNIHPIGGGNTQDYDYGRFALRSTPSDHLTIDLAASFSDESGGMRQGVPSGVPTVFSGNLVGAPLGIVPFVPPEDGVGFFPENRNRVNFNRAQEVGTEFYTITANIEYSFDRISLTSVTGYIESDQTLEGDIDGGSLDLYYETKPISRDSVSQEFRLQSIGDWSVDWTVGGLIARDRGGSNQYTYVGAAQPFGLPEGFFFSPTIEDSESDSEAVFAEATWHASPELDLTVGLRYTNEELTFDSLNPGGVVLDGEQAKFDSVTPRVSASYRLSDSSMVYATISKGFKSGGVQVTTGFEVGPYEPEELMNYEIGLKTEVLDGRIRFNSALYYMDWKDLQAQFAQFIVQPNNDVFLVTGIQNAASARTYGVESEILALITDRLSFGAGASYLNSRFEDFENAFIDGEIFDLSGSTLPNAPELTFNADAEYRVPSIADLDGFARLEWYYRDEVKPSLQSLAYSGFPWDVPSFAQFNLRVGAENERYTVIAYIENLFDENYYTNAYEKAFLSGMYVEPSFRSYGIRITARSK